MYYGVQQEWGHTGMGSHRGRGIQGWGRIGAGSHRGGFTQDLPSTLQSQGHESGLEPIQTQRGQLLQCTQTIVIYVTVQEKINIHQSWNAHRPL